MNEQRPFDKLPSAPTAMNGQEVYPGILAAQYFDLVGGRALQSGDRDPICVCRVCADSHFSEPQ